MANFNCPHCGNNIDLKVTLRDVTKTKHLDPEEPDISKALVGSMSEAISELEHEETKSSISKRMEPKDPLTGLFSDTHRYLLKKRDELYNSGFAPSERDSYEDNTYLLEEKIDAGEEIASKMKNLFGGR